MSATPAKAKRKNGRPTKFSAELVGRILRCVEKGMPLTLAAPASGISAMSLFTYKSKHPAFAEALSQAVARGVESRLEVIEKALASQDESIRLRAACWFLERTQPDCFGRSRVQLETGGQLEVGFIVPQETLNRIAEARERNEQKQIRSGAA